MRVLRALAAPAAVALAAALPLAAASSASAATSTTHLQAHLTSLNGSGASAYVDASLTGTTLTVDITSSGLLAGAPHAQHIHIGGTHSCPSATEKGTGVDGHVRVADAAKYYGMIQASLTTTGDHSATSALAVDRFPVGNASYSRTFTVSSSVASSIRNGDAVIVQHGVDYNGDGTYSGSSKSELDPSLPEEATDPADCGKLMVMPAGSAATGGGSTSGLQHEGTIAAGAAVAVAGVGVYAARRRSARTGA